MGVLEILLVVLVVALWTRTAYTWLRDRRRDRALPVAYIDSRRSRAA